jgi:hypothetical protein
MTNKPDLASQLQDTERITEWAVGMVSAELVLLKTIQHSLEHANEIMKNAL